MEDMEKYHKLVYNVEHSNNKQKRKFKKELDTMTFNKKE